jgi:hypothetical protein
VKQIKAMVILFTMVVLIGCNKVNDCDAVFALISSAKTPILKSAQSSAEKKEEYRRTYYDTWRLCLEMKQTSKDPSAQKLILEKWNNSLIKDDAAVPFQIYALSYPLWDRSFLTDDFWSLLRRTNKKNTIAAISYVLCKNGNAVDMQRLNQKQDSGVDIQLQCIIQNAKNHMEYRLSGDKINPGPSALGPKMIFGDIPSIEINEKKSLEPRRKHPASMDEMMEF